MKLRELLELITTNPQIVVETDGNKPPFYMDELLFEGMLEECHKDAEQFAWWDVKYIGVKGLVCGLPPAGGPWWYDIASDDLSVCPLLHIHIVQPSGGIK